MENQQLTVFNSGFREDQEVKVSGMEYALFAAAVEQLFNGNIKTTYPLQYIYINVTDDSVADKWSKINKLKEQIAKLTSELETAVKSGDVAKYLDMPSVNKTSNRVEAYVGELSFAALRAMEQRFTIHQRELDAGNAISIEVLQEEMQAKSNLQVVVE